MTCPSLSAGPPFVLALLNEAVQFMRDNLVEWMVPLAVFLCLTGLILTLAASIEALAPFVYSIF